MKLFRGNIIDLLKLGYSDGNGDGNAYGHGHGHGDGYGYGFGYGNGNGYGNGSREDMEAAGLEIIEGKNKGETMKKNNKVPCLITTDNTKRGVFMGFIDVDDIDKENIIAEEVRMAVYWSRDMKGVLGLASMGPSKTCRISESVDTALIKGVTAVVELSDQALKRWRKEPWG